MKRGYFERHEDVSGVSGTGRVADLAISSDGRVAVFWPEPAPSVAVFPNLEAVKRAHGHNGKTSIVILDEENIEHCEPCHAIWNSLGINSIGGCEKHDFGCPGCLADAGSN